MNRYFTESHRNRRLHGMVLAVLMLMPSMAWADIVIGGSVYGGGKQGAVGTANKLATEVKAGTPVDADNATTATVVTINGGTLNNVYGGGEMGDSKGQTNVVLKGGSISGSVYGGARMADIDGFAHVLIDGANAVNDLVVDSIFGGNDVSGTIGGKALVESTEGQTKKIYVTNLFGGGNGDYDYASNIVDGNEQNPYAGKLKPEIADVEIALRSGCYFQVFGGGNAATVTNSTKISLNNSTTTLVDGSDNPLAYQFERVFGGNNKEPMAIRPTWDLHKALVNNLYSGGNAGAMTYYDADNKYGGILLAIESADMTVNNVYGGCRMADVDPGNLKGSTADGNTINAETIGGYDFPQLYAARVLIKGGKINNVYGGNDVSGTVYYGSDVEIRSSIIGNVYGAGNGSYAYTDNINLQNDPIWGDYYYDGTKYGSSAKALNIHRPNSSTSLVHIVGTESDPTYIGGAVYCGGNSATLRANVNDHASAIGDLEGAVANLNLGSYVIADKVFLGSNGENMVKSATASDLLQIYKNGPAGYDAVAKGRFNTMDLTNTTDFEDYMSGVEVAIRPTVTFDAGYVPHSTKIGSLFGGGNVGSMTAKGTFALEFLDLLVIYDKLVGGCNNANVEKTAYNAFHMGGLTNNTNLSDGNKVKLDIKGVQLEPRQLTYNSTDNTFSFDWKYEDPDASKKMLAGANIYGGCYASGYVNGGVTINISENAISGDVFTASGVSYNDVRDDVLASTLAAYGGGYGKETEIWGNVNVNITGNGQIMKAYGGGEMGVVGVLTRDSEGKTSTTDKVYDGTNTIAVETFTTNYNTIVTLESNLIGDTGLNAAKLYAGGFQGLVSGNTTLNLNSGRVYDGFGGASNADILGVAHTYVGKKDNLTPHVTHNVYGANDFGGQILGTKVFQVDNITNEMEKIVAQSYVEYVSGRIDGDLFGGPCGAYNYSDGGRLQAATIVPGFTKPQLLTDLLTSAMLTQHSGAGYGANSFVNIISPSTVSTDVISGRKDGDDFIGGIFGAGEGLKGQMGLADEAGSYVRLASATVNQRSAALAPNVYGAGYCSLTKQSLVDAFTGNYGTLFGGCYGVKYQERIDNSYVHNLSYMGEKSAVRLYTMVNQNMDIYGAGANSGSKESGVVLYGGQAADVYGASFNEGITYAASVDVPESSTSKVNRIFGGAKGKADEYACDVYNAFVNYKGTNARVNDAIYGGNNAYRMMRNTYIFIHVPVLDFDNKLTDVFGGGLGENTVTLYTEVNMENGSRVANVYGGGKDGQVLDTPSFRHYLEHGDRCDEGHGGKVYANTSLEKGYLRYLDDYEVISFHDWIDARSSGNTDGNGAIIGTYTPNDIDVAISLYHLSTQQPGFKNTNVYIEQGATVAENAYGGGLGQKAQISGSTGINLHGGVVLGDMYGGGNAGPVIEYAAVVKPETSLGETELHKASTNVYLGGGSVRNVYGGGLGNTADVTGSTNVTMGVRDTGKNLYTTAHDERDYVTLYAGDAVVERSLYGGGQQGAVFGTANVTINQGHIGYKYYAPDAETFAAASDDEKSNMLASAYVENLHLDNIEQDELLIQNGNVFGAGYGEGATVDMTIVNMYGGTIRNSLYGGGEIAAVGRGTMLQTGSKPKVQSIEVAGRTHIYMYNGLVQSDVFGGGRGYSYDLTGNEVIGKEVYTDGYVFGSTDVNIRGGVIGTDATLKDGHGNVFGGGNIGYCFTDAVKDGVRGDGNGEGRYYTNVYTCDKCGEEIHSHSIPTICPHCERSSSETDENFKTTFTAGATHVLSEDTRVIVSPWAQAMADITIDGTTYHRNDYIPTSELNKLADKNSDKDRWENVSQDGVIIRNAVFAGGNVSAGSDKVYANAVTVFGNATATINDIFFRDLITLGTDNIGGLYGDGNLTFVDGYRELNLTNYGTDYYGQDDNITYEKYQELNDRERAYFELQYQTDNKHDYTYYTYTSTTPSDITVDGKTVRYELGKHISPTLYSSLTDDQKSNFSTSSSTSSYESKSKISESVWEMMSADEQNNWTIYGFCSIYAGRMMNTIQRADFCGVFGSRVVLQGAQDRVPEVVDYTRYTINRVGELSLNKATVNGVNHGNYFGMYNVVNYLGALTSDVNFDDVRTTDNKDAGYGADGKSFYEWKVANWNNKKRNNGTSHNMVALASGVFLEIVQEQGSTPDYKNYGLITGVVQLDLINVMPGLGGGYVYAKNVHGIPVKTTGAGIHQNLSVYNRNAVNNTAYTYTEEPVANRKQFETSGNFIHNVKQIVDDCFPGGGRYDNYDEAPAHYWYIRGEMYVYDQYISAYTGSSNAYLENIDLPLSITAGSHGKLDLIDIKQNYYAYYFDDAQTQKLGENGNNTIILNNNTYRLNDIITYWDYMQLSESQKKHFVEQTYVFTADYSETENGTIIEKGEVLLPAAYDSYVIAHPQVWDPVNEKMVPVQDVLHVSNAVSHENGYVLTVDMTNPKVWSNWYSPASGAEKSNNSATGYQPGPTYYTTETGVYGQRYYHKDDIITQSVKDGYDAIPTDDKDKLENQAVIAQAYVAITKAEYDILVGEETFHKTVQEGVGISATEWGGLDAATKAQFAPAYTCVTTFEVDKDQNDYIYYATLIPDTRYEELKENLIRKYKEEDGLSNDDATEKAAQTMRAHFENAFIVTDTEGYYGGRHFIAGNNYRALDTWASLSTEDRKKFKFRYDALDVLVLSNYPGTGKEGGMTAYDGPYWNPESGWPEQKVYGAKQAIDYQAKYEGSSAMTYKDKAGAEHTINVGDVLTREQYESLPNEQHHYSSFKVENSNVGQDMYIVKTTFVNGGTTYAAGKLVEASTYNSLDTDRQGLIEVFRPTAEGIYYICRSSYEVNEFGEGKPVTDKRAGGQTYDNGATVPVGTIITKDNYDNLPIRQTGFVVHGNSPIETSTLYVSSSSDIYDLSKDRVVTVIYQYKYEESDETGLNIEEISERHIVNIHIEFKSGVPTVGQLQEPSVILPGQTVGLKLPSVTEGAYTILGGGWELYTNPEDANKHQNGVEYINNATKMYWYQDGYYVSYYTKTYLGKTYSNAVQFKVANYHDIADVMADTRNYMYIDNPNVKRDSKIYIDNSSEGEIDKLYDLFQTSLKSSKKTIQVTVQDTDSNGDLLYYAVDTYGNKLSTTTTTATPYPVTHKENKDVPVFDDHVRNAANLEFYLMDNVATNKASWQSIGGDVVEGVAQCFSGNLNGNGYTISGLDNSLFNSLCGNVYNLGVTGSFKGSGIADTGDGWVENCWIHTTAEPTEGVKPVFGTVNTTGDGRCTHTYNNYYPVENGYSFTLNDGETIGATAMPLQSFNNGEVAYNLNGFYLAKRYADNANDTGNEYEYWILDSNGDIDRTAKKGHYDNGAYYDYKVSETDIRHLGYVEHLYFDGDYIYENGEVPEKANERQKGNYHLPIWPDDYLFFGQKLTYGYEAGYQDMPSVVNKYDDKDLNRSDRLSVNASNRVYRVPAYFRNSTMDKAYYNTNAYFVAKTKDGSKTIHEGLTALDFTGNNDPDYAKGWNSNMFYTPLVDDDYAKLLGFHSEGITQNLLVYVDDNDLKADGTGKMDAVKEALSGDIKYQETDANYRTVAAANSNGVKGHLVTKTGSDYVAKTDHFLVDKQEFNAPIEYSFAADKRMWYQRTPELYVTLDNKGWEGISLPFTVDLVTTPKKGEITHFYGDSNKGHEYWLRGYAGATYEKVHDDDADKDIEVSVVLMNRPSVDNSADAQTKTVGNTFLWDYYYSKRDGIDGIDANTDDYQQNYYNAARNYEGYAHQQAGVPYIVGFPGSDYYEFDLSGQFVPQNSGTTTPARLAAQVITFASATGANINVSDTVMAQAVSVEGQAEENGATVKKPSGYSFKPNYLATNLAENSYVMNAAGDAFEMKASAVGVPFRPYFEVTAATPASPAPARTKALASKLVIGNSDADTDNPGSAMADHSIRIWSENNTILIENNSGTAARLTVYTSSGQLIKHVNVPSKGREAVKVNGRGIYLVGNTKVIVK